MRIATCHTFAIKDKLDLDKKANKKKMETWRYGAKVTWENQS